MLEKKCNLAFKNYLENPGQRKYPAGQIFNGQNVKQSKCQTDQSSSRPDNQKTRNQADHTSYMQTGHKSSITDIQQTIHPA
jgi:hypothetical protein